MSSYTYEISLKSAPEYESYSASVHEDIDCWHKRLGHLHKDSLPSLLKINMVESLKNLRVSLNGKMTSCVTCVKAKMNRLAFKSEDHARSTRVLELIHSDVCGPKTPVSWNDKRSFVTFLDDYSHFVVIYLLSNKLEEFERFRQSKAIVEAKFGKSVSRLRIDNGGEYTSREFMQFWRHSEIKHEYTIVYNPEQNAVAERRNTTFFDKARAMVLGGDMPKNFWGEAIRTAGYLANRSPTKTLKQQTPAEFCNGQKRDIMKLRAFGSVAYAFTPDYRWNNFDAKS